MVEIGVQKMIEFWRLWNALPIGFKSVTLAGTFVIIAVGLMAWRCEHENNRE